MPGMVKPDPKQDKDPAHPIAPPSANQTTMRHYADGTPDVPAAVANDPGWAARLAQFNKLNPNPTYPVGGPNIAMFSRALPANGAEPAPTPSFAPPLPLNVAHAKAIYDNAVGATTATPPAVAAAAPATAMPARPTSPTPGPAPAGQFDVQLQGAPYQYTAAGGAPAQVLGAQPQFGSTAHAMAAPHQYTRDQFVQALANTPRGVVNNMMRFAHQQTVQQQAAGEALSVALQQSDPQAQERVFELLRSLSVPTYAIPGSGNLSTGQ